MTDVSVVFQELEKNDFRVLNAVERGMKYNEWVPETELPGLARLPREETDYRTRRLNEYELLKRNKKQYVGFQLTAPGYDLLALNAFVNRNSIIAMGSQVDTGKESQIYKCKNNDGEVILKLHREEYTSFRNVDRTRDYTSDKHHTSWMYTARKAAEHEYSALTTLYPQVSVPNPIDQNRHAIVMELFEGVELSRSDVDKPRVVLDAVIEELKKTWCVGYVHSDLSEYNIMVSEGDLRIIDWPQAVETDHPHAGELLERDINNVLSYFERKYPGVTLPEVNAVLDEVRGS